MGGIPYLGLLGAIYAIERSGYFQPMHIYAPLLYTFIFAVFWMMAHEVSGITGYDIGSHPGSVWVWLSPAVVGITIAGYCYWSIAAGIWYLLERSDKKNQTS